MSDADFNPDDIADLDAQFAKITKEHHDGFYIEMFISRSRAREMVKIWLEALLGVEQARMDCLRNYGYIIEEIMSAMDDDY